MTYLLFPVMQNFDDVLKAALHCNNFALGSVEGSSVWCYVDHPV